MVFCFSYEKYRMFERGIEVIPFTSVIKKLGIELEYSPCAKDSDHQFHRISRELGFSGNQLGIAQLAEREP